VPPSVDPASLATPPFAATVRRDVVDVAGPDAVSFLQGQLSQDVAGLAPGTSAWSLLLAPNGKVVAWLRVTRLAAEAVQLDVDGGAGEEVESRLRRFLLRTKAEITLRPGLAMVAVRGVEAPADAASDRADDESSHLRSIVWPGVQGFDVLAETLPAGLLGGTELAEAGEEAYDRLRIAAGVPAQGAELTPETIPAEAGQWLIDASASFTKGCYTGQELVARIDSRGGNVPRPVRRLVVDGPAKVGDPVVSGDGADAAGLLTSAAWLEGQQVTVALAPLSRKVEPGAAVTVAGVPGTVSLL
jgi:folate-binding protein YgfZ